MGEEDFNENLLTEKLSKLNSSQQSIESLSRWCISQCKKAKQVVETWETLFKSVPSQQRVSLLYLANDILQNSRRKGSEFVNEFWKVLPTALKSAYDSGEENCKKVASRLVNIWEERKVFGSRGQNLKSEILGNNPSPGKIPSAGKNHSPVNNGKNSNPIKILKRDANSLRIKLAIGGMPEKILTGFQLVHDEIANEDVAVNKCRNAVSCVREIEKDVNDTSSQGNLLGSDVVDNIQKQENMLQQCIGQLEKNEATRVSLISQLRDALQDQESKVELIRSELLVARVQIEQAANKRLQLTSTSSTAPITNQVIVEPTFHLAMPTNNLTMTSLANPTISGEESKRATAAAVAAKLTASTSSAQMLSSVLSSLAAEEAELRRSGSKRAKLEKPMLFADTNNPEGYNPAYFSAALQAVAPHLPPLQSSTQPISQLNKLQAPFLPPPPPSNSELVQSTMAGLPYGYGSSNLLPLPLSSNVAMGFARPGPPPQQSQPHHPQNQQTQHQQLPLQSQHQHLQNQQTQQQLPANGGYYRPIGIGFYGQSHQPPTPPVQRQ